MQSATETIMSSLVHVNPDSQKIRWHFLNRVLTTTVPHAMLDTTRNDVLLATIQEVVCGDHDGYLKNKRQANQWAMQVGTWINSAYVALQASENH